MRLFRLFLVEQSAPETFYTAMAVDTVRVVGLHTHLDGLSVVDVGAGRPEFATAFADRGARYAGVDVDAHSVSGPRQRGVVATGERLPFADGSVDVALSSNVLEHVADPFLVAEEAGRIVRPGGLLVVSYTNWLSPWGGHETAPWHYLGGDRAVRRYRARHGHWPKNRYGTSLFPVTVRAGLDWARRSRFRVVEAVPRYHPSWACSVVQVPGARELLTWNLLLVLRAPG